MFIGVLSLCCILVNLADNAASLYVYACYSKVMIVAYTEYGIHAIKPDNIVLLAIQRAVIVLFFISI